MTRLKCQRTRLSTACRVITSWLLREKHNTRAAKLMTLMTVHRHINASCDALSTTGEHKQTPLQLAHSTRNVGKSSKLDDWHKTTETHLADLLSEHEALGHSQFAFGKVVLQAPQRKVLHNQLHTLSSCEWTRQQGSSSSFYWPGAQQDVLKAQNIDTQGKPCCALKRFSWAHWATFAHADSVCCYLRIENAEGYVLIAVYLFICMRVTRITQKVLNRIAWHLVGWLFIIRGPFD